MKKHSLTLLTLLGLLLNQAHAADSSYCYQGEVAGVVCSACASNVKAALLKIEGVQEVKITLNKKGGDPKITILSKAPDLTREAAVKALGKAADHYDIRSLQRITAR